MQVSVRKKHDIIMIFHSKKHFMALVTYKAKCSLLSNMVNALYHWTPSHTNSFTSPNSSPSSIFSLFRPLFQVNAAPIFRTYPVIHNYLNFFSCISSSRKLPAPHIFAISTIKTKYFSSMNRLLLRPTVTEDNKPLWRTASAPV